ncbi:MAG: ATP-binding protein [Cyanobacteria bacterium P01_F01_bin.150]
MQVESEQVHPCLQDIASAKDLMVLTDTCRKLLIVDDSKADRTIYRRYLLGDPHQDYSVFEANCAEQGLDLCRDQSFDAILLDFKLPDMSGLQVLDILQQQHPSTAVIMLTGHGSERVAVRAMKSGAQDYLVKDKLQSDVLQHTVRNVVHQTRLRQKLQKKEQQQQLISDTALRIRQSLELAQTLDAAVTEVRQLLECDRVLAYQFAADMSGTIIAESVGEPWTATLGQTVEDNYFQTQGAEDYCQGRKQLVADIHTAGLDPCHVELLEQFEVKASLVTPILMVDVDMEPTEGPEPEHHIQLWGLLVAHQCSHSREWQIDEVELLDALSAHISLAIHHAELLSQTQVAFEREKALNTFRSNIIATVSHEYNAPLTAIRTAASTLNTHYRQLAPQKRQRLLRIIEKRAKHMSALVNDMLMVNQAELNQIELRPFTLPLDQFLTQLIAEQQSLDGDRHSIILKVRGDISGFVGDRGLLRQVFDNLLSNAIKYSPNGGDIHIKLIGEEHHIICQIKDTGIGIPNLDQKQLFQPFSRGSNVGAIPGTGLGLQIVKTAVDLHNGHITVESQQDRGTRVIVRLPKMPLG